LELPKAVKETAGNESVAGKVEEARATKKAMSTVLRSSCADGNSKHILDSEVYPALAKNGARL